MPKSGYTLLATTVQRLYMSIPRPRISRAIQNSTMDQTTYSMERFAGDYVEVVVRVTSMFQRFVMLACN